MLFWDVDTQVDFISPGGRLHVPGAESIVPNLARLTQCACDGSVSLISSACAHHSGDPELKLYGPHCMAGTPGQRKIPETLLPHRYVVPNRPVKLPKLEHFQQIIIEKQAFDVFTNPNSAKLLQQFDHTSRIILYGVVTEICVASAARRLLQYGHRVELVIDAVCALDSPQAAKFVDEFVRGGGELVTTDEVTRADYQIAA